MEPSIKDNFASAGFAIIRNVFTGEDIAHISALFSNKKPGKAGRRNVLTDFPMLTQIIRCKTVRDIVKPVLGRSAFAARALLFDKTPDTNWRVSWHQDKTISVNARAEVSGFSGWSIKDSVPHVQAPTYILDKMLALRIHIDAAGKDSGGLKLYPESHVYGKLSPSEIDQLRSEKDAVQTNACPGDVLVMRPLLLHSSDRMLKGRRRVLHIEFAAIQLPKPLQWHQQVACI